MGIFIGSFSSADEINRITQPIIDCEISLVMEGPLEDCMDDQYVAYGNYCIQSNAGQIPATILNISCNTEWLEWLYSQREQAFEEYEECNFQCILTYTNNDCP